jgi:colanic acid/amylovoran biosynthesis glycosyltransferase
MKEAALDSRPVVLERCDTFVGRTMNWLYDHLRVVPRHSPVVLADRLQNRDEFPELVAMTPRRSVGRWIWRRLVPGRMYPGHVRALRRYRPRLLHSHFGYVAAGDDQLQAALDIPWFVSFYGADVYMLGRLPQWVDTYGRMFEKCRQVLALGPRMAEELQRLGCPPEKISIHPLGIDPASLPSAPRELRNGEPLRVLYAGTFREKKGIPYLVDAVALARDAGVRVELHLVGDASGRDGDAETKEEVFRRIRGHHLEDCTHHHSWLRFDDLVRLALGCHVFVAPSVTAHDGDAEGTPFVIQQMMATGMPVISTLHSDIPFVFGPHAHLLVPERSARAIADRLITYAEDPSRLTADGLRLASHIREALDVRRCAAALSDLYDRYAENGSSGAR